MESRTRARYVGRVPHGMTIPDSTLHLGGLALAHAAWTVSDLPNGETLCPLAFVRRGQDLQLIRFEADSQATAIQGGRAELEKQQSSMDAWAFAREGLVEQDLFELGPAPSSEQGKLDVLTIDIWSHDMSRRITFIQPYQPQATGSFRVLGDALVVVDGKVVDGKRAERMRAHLYQGARKHPKAADLWDRWHTR